MTDFARALLDNAEAFRWLFLIALLWAFYRWMNRVDNPLEWRDFISAIGTDGKYHGDINKVGQCFGVAVSVFAIVATAPKAHTDYVGFAFVLTACLGFLGGVAAYAATLRSKRDRVETTTTVKPAEHQGPMETTVKSSSPAPANGGPPVKVEIGTGADGGSSKG